jgi:hypothetical protein
MTIPTRLLPAAGMVLLLPGGAAAALPTPQDGLILWLDAGASGSLSRDGAHLSAWASKAPGPAVVLTAAATQRPACVTAEGRGPLAAVQFDGRNDVLSCTSFNHRSRTWTLVTLLAPLGPAKGAIASVCPRSGDDFDRGFTVDLYASTRQFDYLSVEGAGRQGGRQNQRTAATPFGAFAVVVVCRDETEIRLYVDGRLEGVRPVTPAETVMDEIRLGARYYAGREREFLRGEVAEVLLYDRVLTAEERAVLETSRAIPPAARQAGEEYGLAESRRAAARRMVPPAAIQSWPNLDAYLTARQAGAAAIGPPLPLEALPIRSDLLEAIRLCMHCLNSSFDADRDGEPFFYSNCRADGSGEFHHSVNIGIPHVTGRCLLGNMAAAQATGLPFPADGLAILTRYLKGSFDNPDHLNSYFDPAKGGKREIEFHNLREGLYGLWALMYTDERDWARSTTQAMLQTLAQVTDANGRWSPALLAQAGMAERCQGVNVPNAARLVEPLLAVHRLTGDPLALTLAGQYARAGLAEVFLPDGSFAPMNRSSGHLHSITSALSGITEFALLSGDAGMIAACRQALAVGVPQYFSSWGWGDEVFPDHPADEVGRGEINQTGDVIRAALHLGAAGEARYYGLAERYLRSMLLPTQHRDTELRRFLHDTPQPPRDAERDVLGRSVGGFSMQLPNDRMQEGDWPIQTQDITSGAVHALAECWRHRATLRDGLLSVNLLFDCDSPAVRIRSGLPLAGRVSFHALHPVGLRVRVPEWVDPATVRVSRNGTLQAVTVVGGYVVVGPLAAADQGEVTFALPCKVERETVDGTEYTTTWVGDQLLDIRPRGTVSPLPF